MTPEPLKIDPSISQSDCEAIATKLEANAYPRLEVPLHLTSEGALGLDARVTQLIVQWARANKDPTIVLPVGNTDVEQLLSKLALNDYGLAALSLARHVMSVDGIAVPPATTRSLVKKRLDDFSDRNFKIFGKEEGISFLSIYNHPQEYAEWLFAAPQDPTKRTLHTPRDVGAWLKKIIAQLIPSELSERFDENRRTLLGVASYELLENAHLHGRLNEFADSISGVCGIAIRVVRVSYDTINVVSGGNSDVDRYFLQRILRDKSKQDLFLEITVFDSGIGYHRWINAPCNLREETQRFRGKTEAETVLNCLFRHSTSKAGDGAGVGLFRVIRLLKKLFGFIKIRTGRSCYYTRLDQTVDGKLRQLGETYVDSDTSEIELREWFPGKVLPEAAGTIVTICSPLTHWR